jgi:hypothetical protein
LQLTLQGWQILTGNTCEATVFLTQSKVVGNIEAKCIFCPKDSPPRGVYYGSKLYLYWLASWSQVVQKALFNKLKKGKFTLKELRLANQFRNSS